MKTMTAKTNLSIDFLLKGMAEGFIEFDYDTREVNPLQGPTNWEGHNYELKLWVDDDNLISIQLTIHLKEDFDHSSVHENLFKYFEALELVLWYCYQEGQNNDPCDFNYDLNTDHLGETWKLTVKCTDYLS